MIEAFVTTLALALPADGPREGSRPQQAPKSQPNRWQDSGASVWEDTPTWIRDLGLCIRRHESLHAGHYNAENPSSTASGAYQFLDGTWRGIAKWVKGAEGYRRASDAPPMIQDKVFIHSILHGGIHAWNGTWCPGT